MLMRFLRNFTNQNNDKNVLSNDSTTKSRRIFSLKGNRVLFFIFSIKDPKARQTDRLLNIIRI